MYLDGDILGGDNDISQTLGLMDNLVGNGKFSFSLLSYVRPCTRAFLPSILLSYGRTCTLAMSLVALLNAYMTL